MMSNVPKLAAPISNPRGYCAANRHPPFQEHVFKPGNLDPRDSRSLMRTISSR